MKKWARRSLLVVALMVALLAVLSGVGVALFKGEPQWYRAAALAPQQKQTLARDAENKLIEAQNWAALVRADAVRAERATTTLAPRAQGTYTVEFSQDELNSLFEKWSSLHGWRDKYEDFLDDPRLVLRDGHLILAGRVKELGTVTSLQFRPQIDDQGRMRLDLVRVMGGRLPLPDAAWRPWRDKMLEPIRGRVPAWQAWAKVDPQTGAANQPAVSVVLARLMLAAFARQPTDAVLFLPVVDRGQSIAVRVTQVTVHDGKMTMQVQPLTMPERTALLNRIRTGS